MLPLMISVCKCSLTTSLHCHSNNTSMYLSMFLFDFISVCVCVNDDCANIIVHDKHMTKKQEMLVIKMSLVFGYNYLTALQIITFGINIFVIDTYAHRQWDIKHDKCN
jgi:hypothetical protein